MLQLNELTSYLETLAPHELTENWDNTGLLVECGQTVSGVLCALDVTPQTVQEAQKEHCNVIVSHHPVIFRPLRSLSEKSVPALLMRAGISAVCMHTNLDKASGGVNDHLAQMIGLCDVTEFADGIGRIGMLHSPMCADDFAHFVGKRLHTSVKFADAGNEIRKIALVTGSGGDFVREAAHAGAHALLTGEASHHDALDAKELGITLVAATHYATETGIADVLAKRIKEQFPQLHVVRSTTNCDPFFYI